MKTAKHIFLPAALLAVLSATSVLAESREALRARLDSINVETQVRKRAGLPIDDLETASAALRDSIVVMRSAPPSAYPEPDGEPSAFGGGLLASIGSKISSFLESALSFKPTGLFDWVIVCTGMVAILSGLLLFIGIAAGRRKGAAKKKTDAEKFKRINQAPAPAATPPVIPELPTPGQTYTLKGLPSAPPEQRPVPPELESLMENLRKKANTQPLPALSPAPAPPPAESAPLPPPPPPPPAPSPLVINAPDSSPSQRARGRDVLRAGSPGFSDAVAADSKNGMSDVEISRRYQISVDQVRLMLRMKQD